MTINLKDKLALERIRNFRGVSTRLTSQTIDRLDEIAKANDSTLGAVIRVAVEYFVDVLDKDPALAQTLTTKTDLAPSAEAR